MPKHPDIERAKSTLEAELRELCESGEYEPQLVPSLRELSERHGLSKSLAQRVVRGLCDEGLLFPVHGMGTFAGRKPGYNESKFLYLYEDGYRYRAIRHGFEDRLSAIGALSLSMTLGEAARQFALGLLPEIHGVWDPSYDPKTNRNLGPALGAPIVGYDGRVDSELSDSVTFDHFQGGKNAAQHLLSFGYRHLVFLGAHLKGADVVHQWSERRESGFISAVTAVGVDSQTRIFLPDRILPSENKIDPVDYFSMGAALAHEFLGWWDPLKKLSIGIVAANDRLAYGFIAGCLRAGVKPEKVPPIIGFDNMDCAVGSNLSSMDLPWHEMGKVAADVLFARVQGDAGAKPQVAHVPMIPITRLSSRKGWLAFAPALTEALLTRDPDSFLPM